MYDAYGSRQISTIYAPNDEYKVEMEVEPQYQDDPSTLSLLYVRSQNGPLVPLSTVVKFIRGVGPLAINHSGQLPAVTISFDLAPGVSLAKGLDEVQQLARETLPASFTTSYQGTAQAFEDSLSGLGMLLLMTILIIYLVLGILYESFIHPITILSGLPSAGFGALITLWLFGMQLDLFAFVGIIMLVGLVKKNAIMMIDFALDVQRTEGKTPFGGDFRGRHHPLSPHYDDDDGGADGSIADRPGGRGRLGIAATTGSGGGRRPGVLPVPHPLHNAGGLYLHGELPGPGPVVAQGHHLVLPGEAAVIEAAVSEERGAGAPSHSNKMCRSDASRRRPNHTKSSIMMLWPIARGNRTSQTPLAMRESALTRWISPGITRKFVVLNFLLFALAVTLTVLTIFAITIISGVRAYVAGEGLYAKYQKDSVFYLRRYVQTGKEADYSKFSDDILVPLGDGEARRALDRPSPDRDDAARSFRAGHNATDDVPAMVKLFLRFRHLGFVDTAIGIWRQADGLTDQLADVGRKARERVGSGRITPRGTGRFGRPDRRFERAPDRSGK